MLAEKSLLNPNSDQAVGTHVKRVLRVRKNVVRLVVAVALLALLFHRSSWGVESFVHDALVRLGIVLLAVAVAGRVWAWSHLGRRRLSQFVSDGPYSVVRHPLYVFSLVGATGIGALTGSLTVTLLALLTTATIFSRMARVEEDVMRERFGEPYQSYLTRTPRFIPNFRLWNAPETISIEYAVAIKGFRDASVFMAAIPIFMMIDWAQRAGVLPVLFRLP